MKILENKLHTNKVVKIGLDYHGVIDVNPQYFTEFCRLAHQLGILIYIITGGTALEVKKRLKEINLQYDFIFSVLDYCIALGYIEQDIRGNVRIKDKMWNQSKANFCRSNNITLHIDDSSIYKEYFTTNYCFYDNLNKKCQLSENIEIHFNDEPQESLAKLINSITY